MLQTTTYSTKKLNDIIKDQLSSTIQDDDFYYLFKYLSFDENLFVLDTFNKTHLKYTKPNNFNDPYDCHFKTKIDLSDFSKKKAEEVFKIKIPTKIWIVNKKKFEAQFTDMYENQFIPNYRNKIAISCFTIDPCNMLMWSHYAQNHSGFVIEFKFPKNKNIINYIGSEFHPLPVIYTNKYPTITLNWNSYSKDLDDHNIQTNLLTKMILTKSDYWSYENEFRIAIFDAPDDNSIILRPFESQFISNVIIGSKTKEEHLKKLSNSIKAFNDKHKSNVKIYKSEMMEDRYQLKVPHHPLLKLTR